MFLFLFLLFFLFFFLFLQLQLLLLLLMSMPMLMLLRQSGVQCQRFAMMPSPLKELGDISNLADKLATCSQHAHGLQNLYKNLSKREAVL